MSSSALPIGSLNANNTAIKVADGWLSTKKGTPYFVCYSNGIYRSHTLKDVAVKMHSKTAVIFWSDDYSDDCHGAIYTSKDNVLARCTYLKNSLAIFGGERGESGDMVFVVNKGEIKAFFLVKTTVAKEGKYDQVAWKLIELDKTVKLKDGSFAHEDWTSNKISGRRVNGNYKWAKADKLYSTYNEAKANCELPYERASVRNARAMMMMFGGDFDLDRRYSYDDWEQHKRNFEAKFALQAA